MRKEGRAVKKLRLSKETLQGFLLSDINLGLVLGGDPDPPTCCVTCPPVCGGT
jgi:hypothetical protein